MILKDVDYEIVYEKGTENEIIFKLKKLTVKDVKMIQSFFSTIKSKPEDLNDGKITDNADIEKITDYAYKMLEIAIVDWDNVKNESNEDIPYSFEVFQNLPLDVFNYLSEKVMEETALTKTEKMEQVEKN